MRVQLDREGLGYAVERALRATRDGVPRAPARLERLGVGRAGQPDELLPFDVNLWKSQNVFYDLLKTVYPRSASGSRAAMKWRALGALFIDLGTLLSVTVP
jgi:hypothetical protein